MPLPELSFVCKTFESLSTEELYEILRVRQEVFVVGQKILYVDCDRKDQQSLHCYAMDSTGTIVAYVRIVGPGYKFKEPAIGRVLTTDVARGKGIGKEMMKFALREVNKHFGSSTVRISAQQYLEKFYSDLGFRTVSEAYEEEGIMHIEMLFADG